jgi:CRISPR/Cas system-associated exonuclease Cas4 (RecB family)
MKPVISHSEVSSFSLCKLRHYYAFGEKLRRSKRSDALNRGIVGHQILQGFFGKIKEGYSVEQSLEFLTEKLQDLIKSDTDSTVAVELFQLMHAFINRYGDEIARWKVKSIEDTYLTAFPDFIYAFTPDLIISKPNGKVELLDWKFTYDFYDGKLLSLLPQLPRYIGALRASGIHVDAGRYGFFRYRKLKNPTMEDQSSLVPIILTQSRIDKALFDLSVVAGEIVELKTQPMDIWKEKATRVYDPVVCSRCPFTELCTEELHGGDGLVARRFKYEKSDYGYEGQ